ncbi:MAG: hypothetical protein ICV68_00245 [Pyrinomonadaceae bacterium]|nr:hypothetical protein [Pyrinomonadaceae bacterium]
MSDIIVSAEIVPLPERAQSAAKALQQLGFRVLRIDSHVSVEAPEKLWTKVFRVSFKKKSKPRFAPSASSSIDYGVPKEDSATIPDSLRELITEVIFVQPPEFF